MNSPSGEPTSSKTKVSPAPSPTTSIASTTDTTTTSRPDAYVSEKPDDSSKLRTLLSILRKFIGVSDIASVRFSLPAQLLEPTPNLEYWNYLDRPETFVAIGDSNDGLGRMLEVLRFWFTKDLKYVKGKPCKPYNSTLGEFFRCNWDVEDNAPPLLGETHKESATHHVDTENKQVRVSYITEQTSHHPPVSAFYVDCPVKGISARGFDQLSAKFTGTSIRVTPGAHNLGIFINLKNRDDEEYQLTHPIAHLGGLLRGSLSVTVADSCFLTCRKTKIKVILHYLEENWVGKTQNKVNGVVYTYDPDKDNKTRIKDVPEKDILARLDGCWHDQIFYTLQGSKDSSVLLDLRPLFPTAKIIPPLDQQLPNESQRFWAGVTRAIKGKQYAEATKLKQEIEERQRDKATQRQEKNEDWKPRFFTDAITANGKPDLTEDGKKALQGLQAEDYGLKDNEVTGA
ncbi:oxysterol-binding protein-like protein [Usnea florida]